MFGRTMLIPCQVLLDTDDRDATPSNLRIVGIAPAFRMVNIKYLNVGDVVDTVWKIFPHSAKRYTNLGLPYSSDYGLAYRMAD